MHNIKLICRILKTPVVLLVTALFLFFIVPTLLTKLCYDNTSLVITSNILFILSNAAILILPAVFVIRTGRFKQGVLLCWFLQFLSEIVFIGYGAILYNHCKANQLNTTYVVSSFPDGPRILFILVFGWFPALIVCGIALGIRIIFQKYHCKPDTQ
jgi:hypothetical protein